MARSAKHLFNIFFKCELG